MPQIRTKTISILYWTHDQHGSLVTASFTDTVPIRDWAANPAVISPSAWTVGQPSPAHTNLKITFPEMAYVANGDYPGGFRFKIRKNFSGVDFVQITSDTGGIANDVFTKLNAETETVKINFQNLDNLPAGAHQLDLVIEAYGLDRQGNETFVEDSLVQEVLIPVKITVLAGNSFNTDKPAYVLQYNKADNSLSGDRQIIVYSAEAVSAAAANSFLQLETIPGTTSQQLNFKTNPDLSALPVGNHDSAVTITRGTLSKTVPVQVQVTNDETQFYLEPQSFSVSIQKDLGESAEMVAELANPNQLNCMVDLYPSFISSVVIAAGKVKITTKNSEELALGNYAGDVIIKAGAVSKKIYVKLSVLKGITHNFSGEPYYFAQDKRKVFLSKNQVNASDVRMTLNMFFRGYGIERQEEQVYTFPFFRNNVEIDPGEEIQDFFIRARDFNPERNPAYMYDLAVVSMRFEEIDSENNSLSTFTLPNMRFAPGKKPRCFPYFTNYPVRSFYPGSLIKLNKDMLSSDFDIAGSIRKPTVEQFKLDRSRAQQNQPISRGPLSFIPLPFGHKPVHIEFETENLVFEWFTAEEKFVQTDEVESVVGESAIYKEEKYDAVLTKTITVNTGWILEEEIELITDLMRSRLCYITHRGQRFKAFCTSKKNEMKNNESNLFSMDLEFKKLLER